MNRYRIYIKIEFSPYIETQIGFFQFMKPLKLQKLV